MRKILIFLVIFAPFNSFANQIDIVRDAEIEEFLHDIVLPIADSANLNIDDVRFFIVNDNELNAFVSGGQNVFVNLGLISKYKTPYPLIGVLAHEMGHIEGGHIAKMDEAMKDASTKMILTYLAGILSASQGSVDAGEAIILGSNHIAERSLLKYSRGNEEAADRFASQVLKKNHFPVDGLVKLLQDLSYNQRENIESKYIDKYSITHPITSERIDFLTNFMLKNQIDTDKESRRNLEIEKRFALIVAKIDGFMMSPQEVFAKYKAGKDTDLYAIAIAKSRSNDQEGALSIITKLTNKFPKNPYFKEVKGQILYEKGSIPESIFEYWESYKLKEGNLIDLVSVINAINTYVRGNKDENWSSIKKINKFAITEMKKYIHKENDDPGNHKALATAYFNNGEDGMAYIEMAEYSLLKKESQKVEFFLNNAIKVQFSENKIMRKIKDIIRASDEKCSIKNDVVKCSGF